ncbi:MAG: TIGR03118 family protein [Planctomycetes bacterium]|nr:TIGR03118 family protein [Planctomycetota bacterium]
MRFPSLFPKNRAASDRQHSYRPVLEGLEDRCLLSRGFGLVNLASDVPGLARVTDLNLVNPWGIAFSPTGPFWFGDNGSGVSDLLDGRGQPVPLVVTVPPSPLPLSPGGRGEGVRGTSGTPTGTVFNGGAGFAISEDGVSAPSRFLFATQDGTISGWTAVVDPTRALLVVDNSSSGAVYTGLALAADPAGHRFLYAADFSRGTIDVFDQAFRPVVRPGSFQDPNLPDGFAPFNIQNINNLLFVTYAQQDEDSREDIAGVGHGFIDVYHTDGSLVRRFASGGALNSPWGLALAPADWRPFGGALLVGNNGDGHINAYDPGSGTFLGDLADDNGTPIAIPNLWALTLGNGHAGGDADTLFFAAGIDDEEHGLFGAIQAPGRRGADTAGAGAFDPNAPGEPGDYPLPPSGGPAFRASSEDRPIPIAALLPLRESSLALAPTLSTFSQPSMRIEAPVPAAPRVGVSLSGSVFTAVPASHPIMLLPADGNSQPARGALLEAVALNTFLDLNASQNVSQKADVQRPGTNRQAVGARRSPSADRDVRAEGLLSETYAEQLETPSSEEQGPGALPASGQADEVLAVVPPESRAESADEGSVGNKSVLTQNGSDWTTLMNLLFVVSLPMIWTYWLRHQTRSQQSSAEHARSDLAKRRSDPMFGQKKGRRSAFWSTADRRQPKPESRPCPRS